ncbi:MAG: Uma2 family endonuclease [Microcoleus vaginatus WJT46-NPBG5]|jgi:Uma2 family endonuclease|nr:Uma2 family endonuclease [Microcoleus vaginatus WJT46-NPBG5]
MIANPSQNYLSPEEYLAQEENSAIKHEYIDGQVYAMAGASDAHVTIAGNLFALLRNHVRGTGCRVYMADMKVQIETANLFYYPDVMVTCDARDRQLQSHKKYPCLIVEVVSESTEAFDRGDKFANYHQLETLQEYVLISQKHQRLDCFCRNAEGVWALQFYHAGSEIHLTSIDFPTSVDALYEDVTFAGNEET